MKIKIENYKGQLIEYDDDYDQFVCEMSSEDKWKKTKRMSLVAVRKEIDTFIKTNADFKPFKVLDLGEYDKSDFKVLDISGIRTDGKLVSQEGATSYKSYCGKKQTKNWMQYDSEVVAEKNRLKAILDEATIAYSKSLKNLISNLKPIDLSKYEHLINKD